MSFFLDQKEICFTHFAWSQFLLASEGLFCSDLVDDSFMSNGGSRGKIVSIPKNTRGGEKKSYFKYFIFSFYSQKNTLFSLDKIRIKAILSLERLRESASFFFRSNDPLGLFRKLILNENSPEIQEGIFRRLGFVHLFSATGIHLYALGGSCYRFIGFLFWVFRGSPQIGIWLSRVATFSLCFFIWLLSGGRAGLLRPWMVLLIRKCGHFLGFHWCKGSPLIIAFAIEWGAFLLGLKEASQGFYLGQWIYALAVGGGIFWSEIFSSGKGAFYAFRKVLGEQGGAHFGLAVGSWVLVALYDMGERKTIALATPLFSFLTLPILCSLGYPIVIFSWLFSLCGFQVGGHTVFSLFSQVLHLWIHSLAKSATHLGNLWIVPSGVFFPSTCLAGLVVLKVFKKKGIFFIIFLILILRILSLYFTEKLNPSILKKAEKVQQLDVGQGDAAFIFTHEWAKEGDWKKKFFKSYTIGLIDSGSERALSDDAWMQILSDRKINKIAWVGLTHLDEDHMGGLLRLAKWVRIGCVVAPSLEIESERGLKIQNQFRELGIYLKPWESSCIPYPHFVLQDLGKPSKKRLKKNRSNRNMGVVWVPLTHAKAYLAAGDTHGEDEFRLLKWISSNQLKAEHLIFKVNHHGSHFSNTQSFLKKLSPSEAWISSGNGNRYGHPSLLTLRRLESLGIPIRRTDMQGFLSSDLRD